jgi:hypothetical protein
MDQWACHPASRPGLGAVLAPRAGRRRVPRHRKCSGSFHRLSGGRGTRARGKGVPAPLHDHIDARIELSLDVGGSALLGEPVKPAQWAGPGRRHRSRSSDPARRGRQLRRREGSRGSDPRLLGLAMGGYLIAHSGSDPVVQRSSALRVRPMHNLSANTVIILARHLETFSRYVPPALAWPRRGPGRGIAPRLARCVSREAAAVTPGLTLLSEGPSRRVLNTSKPEWLGTERDRVPRQLHRFDAARIVAADCFVSLSRTLFGLRGAPCRET